MCQEWRKGASKSQKASIDAPSRAKKQSATKGKDQDFCYLYNVILCKIYC